VLNLNNVYQQRPKEEKMKKPFLPQLLSGLSVLLLAGAVQASVITNAVNFSDSQTTSGSGVIVHAGSSGLTGNFSPFNTSLGTLDSFIINWQVAISASGTANANASGGGISEGLGGSTYLNAIAYNGFGGGKGAGGAPNAAIPTTTATASNVRTHLPSDAGITYDPTLLSIVTGGSNFDITFKNVGGNTVYNTYTNMADITSTMTGSVTLTYNYTPAVPEPSPVPEPSTFALLCLGLGVAGFVRKKMTKCEG
jgi:hypothetical protein